LSHRSVFARRRFSPSNIVEGFNHFFPAKCGCRKAADEVGPATRIRSYVQPALDAKPLRILTIEQALF
jgi:hypothetical protein